MQFQVFYLCILVQKEGKSQKKCYYYNLDVLGFNLNDDATADECSDKTDTARECRMLCYFTRECAQFTWIDKSYHDEKRHKNCCMKKIYRNHYIHTEGAISGLKYCNKETYEGAY